MERYGQTLIAWSTVAAPHPFTGTCTSYSYNESLQRLLDEDEAGGNRALIQHSHKAAISFEAKVTDSSTDFLDLSAGAALTITGIATGVVLASRAVERWALGQPKTASVQATHYPDMATGGGAAAGIVNSAYTPTQALSFVLGGKLIYGTSGLTQASGVVHGLTLTQELTIVEDAPSPAGTILGAVATGYLRTIQLDILATSTIPAVGTKLVLGGSLAMGSDYQVETAEPKYESKRGMMYSVGAVWIPPLTVSS
jgi:hypothetical protein